MFLFKLNCVHNYEPIIKKITAEPNPVSADGLVELRVFADDEDINNTLKTEILKYQWDSSYGTIKEDDDSIATWQAPSDTGAFSITCIVTDQYNGLDVATIIVEVQ